MDCICLFPQGKSSEFAWSLTMHPAKKSANGTCNILRKDLGILDVHSRLYCLHPSLDLGILAFFNSKWHRLSEEGFSTPAPPCLNTRLMQEVGVATPDAKSLRKLTLKKKIFVQELRISCVIHLKSSVVHRFGRFEDAKSLKKREVTLGESFSAMSRPSATGIGQRAPTTTEFAQPRLSRSKGRSSPARG